MTSLTYRSCKEVILPISFGMLPLILFHIKSLAEENKTSPTKIKMYHQLGDDITNDIKQHKTFQEMLTCHDSQYFHTR